MRSRTNQKPVRRQCLLPASFSKAKHATCMKQLLLLHGALGSEDQFDDLKRVLSPHFEIFTLNFYGHGTSAPSTEPLRIEAFSEQVLDWLEKKQISQISIFGYSMGGFVALHLAANHP